MTINQVVKTMQVTLSVVMSQSCSVTTVVITGPFESLCEQIILCMIKSMDRVCHRERSQLNGSVVSQREITIIEPNLCLTEQTEVNTHCHNEGHKKTAIIMM